jgi:malonyl CoA-acyl carrier protein transacylase
LVIAHVKATVGDLEACFVVTGKVVSLKALEASVRRRGVVETVWDGYVTYTIN